MNKNEYELNEIDNLPQDDDFYKIKIGCGFKEGMTKTLNISPIQLKEIREIFNK
jgi:hypothetical protein